MRILTYKRTHVGDPDRKGRFGIYDCMGKIRAYAYDAVIGVGGIGKEPESFGIDRRINWVGINPLKAPSRTNSGVEVRFKYFLLLEEKGPMLETLAPFLSRRLYQRNVRVLLSGYSDKEFAEAKRILNWAKKQRRIRTLATSGPKTKVGCRNRCKRI